MSGTGTTDADGGQVNLPLGVSVALGEIAIMVAVSVLVKLVSAGIDTVTVLLFRYLLCLPLLVATAHNGGAALLLLTVMAINHAIWQRQVRAGTPA